MVTFPNGDSYLFLSNVHVQKTSVNKPNSVKLGLIKRNVGLLSGGYSGAY